MACQVVLPTATPGAMTTFAHNIVGYRASAAGCTSFSSIGTYTLAYNNAFYKLPSGSNGLASATDSQIQYNLFEQASLSGIGSSNVISNNHFDLNFTSGVFQFPAGGPTLDSHFKLATGSVGLGAGSAGADIGVYGENTPYQASGLIPIPMVYAMIAAPTGTATVPLTVELKIISPKSSF
ncbi:MAG: hypothetical protein J0L94_01640 [Rhodothermia bacterium]|nr:hypothetical protein [Rhodothermia bacterium]